MSSLDRLPERALASALQQSAEDAAELKGSFQRFGSRSVVTRRIFSANAYDFSFVAPTTPGNTKVNVAEVEFIPDDKTFGGAFAHRMEVTTPQSTSGGSFTGLPVEVQRMPSSDGRQIWRINQISYGYTNDTPRIKVFFYTTGSGTFTTNVIS